jgi:paraquat-inducible protein B
MDPGRAGKDRTYFNGLEVPPVVSMDTPGSYFNLQATRLGSLDAGSPVYFRQIKVGQVVSYQMQSEGTAIDLQIFIESPHDGQVNGSTHFWNASGFDLTADTTGVRIKTESFTTMIYGGIAFETPAKLEPGEPVDKTSHVFTLYESYGQIGEPLYQNRFYFMAFFDDTVRGLNIGAPVEFRGIKVGEVVDVKLEFNPEDISFRIPVLCFLDPSRINISGTPPAEEADILAKLVEKGLRAQLRTGVLLTGQLYVNLATYPAAETEQLHYAGGYPVLPTVPEPVEEITASLVNLLDRFERLPMEEIGSDLRDTVKHARQLVSSKGLTSAVGTLRLTLDELQRFVNHLNNSLGPQASAVLQESQQALSAAKAVLDTDSPMNYELNRTLKEISRAARAVGELADVLERNPQILIYGKGTANEE